MHAHALFFDLLPPALQSLRRCPACSSLALWFGAETLNQPRNQPSQRPGSDRKRDLENGGSGASPHKFCSRAASERATTHTHARAQMSKMTPASTSPAKSSFGPQRQNGSSGRDGNVPGRGPKPTPERAGSNEHLSRRLTDSSVAVV